MAVAGVAPAAVTSGGRAGALVAVGPEWGEVRSGGWWWRGRGRRLKWKEISGGGGLKDLIIAVGSEP